MNIEVTGTYTDHSESIAVYDDSQRIHMLSSDWLNSLRSQKTRKAYETAMNEFISHSQKVAQESNRGDIISFRNFLKEDKGLANTTVNLKLSAIRSFFAYIVENQYLQINPAIGVKGYKVNKFGKTHALSVKKGEHRKLLESIGQETITDARDFAICLLILTSGVRVSAIADMKAHDIFKKGSSWLFTFDNKAGEQHEKKIDKSALFALNVYLDMKPVDTDDYVFEKAYRSLKSTKSINAKSLKMTRQAISTMIMRRAKKAGFDNISAHSLRHTSALILKSREASIETVQKHLIHSNPETSLIYLSHLSDSGDEDIVESVMGDEFENI